MTEKNVNKSIIKGEVIKINTGNTVQVLVRSTRVHPIYRKQYSLSRRFMAHCELKVELGDIVEIESCRPISKLKKYKVVNRLTKD